MTIPPLGLDDSEILDVFNRTRELAVEIQQQNWSHIQMQQRQWACRTTINWR